MPRNKRSRIAVLATGCALAAGLGSGPAAAQPTQQGLVNVAITDNNVQVPVSIAANICDVNVGVLAQQERAGGATCDADATSLASHNTGGGGNEPGAGGTAQDGLVNVDISGNNVQVPVSVAANVCDLNVGILARQLRLGGAECDADAESMATRGPGAGGGLL